MSSKISDTSDKIPHLLPDFPSYQAARQFLMKYPPMWKDFLQLPDYMQQELLNFCIGKNGLRITYDPVFRRIFQPELHKDRLESFLSSILNKNICILEILPREGTRLTETGSFIIMDILVRLNDGSYANIEMQKIGYNFPLARADCYASDIILRQYEKTKEELGKHFTFSNLHKVYCIVLMEESPAAFHSIPGQYIHKRAASFNTGIYPDNAGLHEDIFICLDIFRSIVHTISERSTLQEAWLTFFSTTNINSITALTSAFPMFLPIYQEITDFVKNPKELMHMFSEALYIMDRNMERQMLAEMRQKLQQEIADAKAELNAELSAANAELDATNAELNAANAELDATNAELNAANAELDATNAELNATNAELNATNIKFDTVKAEADIFRLRLLGKSAEEIAEKLAIPLAQVIDVLASLNE